MAKIAWVGLVCCLAALGVQTFPEAAFRLGVDARASWLVLGFGIFLIVFARFEAGARPRNDERRGH